MKAIVAFNFLFSLFILVIGCDGKEDDSSMKIRYKRLDGLVGGLLDQMVAERLERNKILDEFKAIKTKFDDVTTDQLKFRKTVVKNMKIHQATIHRDVRNMKKEVKKRLTGVEKRIGFISKDVNNMKKKRNEDWKQIAFSTKLGHHLKTSSAIKFKNVITNIGRGYNFSDGIFYCPKDGVYTFSVTLLCRFTVYITGFLMKNNQAISQPYENGGTLPSASVTIILKLVSADIVWVQGSGIKYDFNSYFTGAYLGP